MVTLRLERRAGKNITLVEGLPMHPDGKRQVLRRLQELCGAGGTLKGGVLEIQGDHRPRLAEELARLGHKVKPLK